MQRGRDLVDRIGVERRDHGLGGTLVNSEILRRSPSGTRPVSAAQHHVGLDTDLAQFLHRVLRRLGLHFARCGDEGQQRQMDVADVVPALSDAHLPDRFEEGQ